MGRIIGRAKKKTFVILLNEKSKMKNKHDSIKYWEREEEFGSIQHSSRSHKLNKNRKLFAQHKNLCKLNGNDSKWKAIKSILCGSVYDEAAKQISN